MTSSMRAARFSFLFKEDKILIMNCELSVANCELSVMSYELSVMS